jgi:hypothetical protein
VRHGSRAQHDGTGCGDRTRKRRPHEDRDRRVAERVETLDFAWGKASALVLAIVAAISARSAMRSARRSACTTPCNRSTDKRKETQMTAPMRLLRDCAAGSILAMGMLAHADTVTDWNAKANEILAAGKVGPPPANRALAIAHAAAFDAVDAKCAYNFWRPVTAIRNGDRDGNDATERDPTWTSFIDTPMHPEYPYAHCIVASALGAVLQAEIGNAPLPRLEPTSPTLPGVTRSWNSIAEFTQEVSDARVYDGVHYRNSTEVGAAMGRKLGEMAVAKFLHCPGCSDAAADDCVKTVGSGSRGPR